MPICEACRLGRIEIVRLLLNDKRVLAVDGYYHAERVVNLAAGNGHCAIVRLLVEDRRVNPELCQHFAFRYYCMSGDVERVKMLLSDTQYIISSEEHSIVVACEHDRADVVKLLLADSRLDPSVHNNKAIHEASKNGYAAVVKLLLADSRVEASSQCNKALHEATKYGHACVVQLLLFARVYPIKQINNMLRQASANGHGAVVELLLAYPRIDPSARDNLPLREAGANGHEDVVQMLLTDMRVDPSGHCNEAIQLASQNGHVSVVKLLLNDPRVDASAPNKWAHANIAIQLAAENDHSVVVKMLLADSRVLKLGGEKKCFESALKYGKLKVLQMLLGRPGVEVSKESLMTADENSQAGVINLFINEQRHLVWKLCSTGQIVCKRDGVLREVLDSWEANSARFLLFCVKNTQTPVVAGRLSDVLREVLERFARFHVM